MISETTWILQGYFVSKPYHILKFINCAFQETTFIQFKVLQGDKDFTTANVCPSLATRKKHTPSAIPIEVNEREYKKPNIILSRKQKNTKELNEKKEIDLISMLKYMPLIDREYYKTVGAWNWFLIFLILNNVEHRFSHILNLDFSWCRT